MLFKMVELDSRFNCTRVFFALPPPQAHITCVSRADRFRRQFPRGTGVRLWSLVQRLGNTGCTRLLFAGGEGGTLWLSHDLVPLLCRERESASRSRCC